MPGQPSPADRLSSVLEGNDPVQLLLRGRLSPQVDHPSLIFFTVHKCASAYVADILARIANSQGIVPIDFDTLVYEHTEKAIDPFVSPEFLDYYCQRRTSISESVRQEIQQRLPSRGFYYGAIRATPFFHRIPHFEQFKTILMVRDPRDALTSLYFSVAFSHGEPTGAESVRQQFLVDRERARKLGVDQYVLRASNERLSLYTQYCNEVLGRPNTLLVKYEEMVHDFRSWLDSILQFWGLPTNTRTVRRLVNAADFSVTREDPNSHKRQVQPGDHQRKLQPRTVRQLDKTFATVLDRLGYARSSAGGREAA